MALSGSIYGSIIDGHYTIRVDWSATQSAANNTSTVTAKIYLVNDWALNVNARTQNTISIGGTQHFYDSPAISTVGTHLLDTVTSGALKHKDDGTLSISIGGRWNVRANISGTYYESIKFSATVTLNTIARVSQPSCITWPEHTQNVGYFGDTISIHMNRHSDSFTHTVRYAFGSRTGTIATGVTTGTTWKIPESFMDLLPAALSGSGTIYADTYLGSTLIGTKYCGFTARVPDDLAPTVSVTLTDTTGHDKTYGSPVQGLSKIKVEVNPTLAYSSPIVTYSTKIDTSNFLTRTGTTRALKSSGNSLVYTEVKDQRGRIGTWSYTMKVLPYEQPHISELTVHRSNAGGTESPNGEYVTVKFNAAITALNNKNTAAYKLRYKKSSATTYTTVTLSAYAGKYTVTGGSYTFAADGNSSYDVELVATDAHNTTTRATSASTAFTLINWGAAGNNMAVGKVAEKDNTLEVALESHFYSSAVFEGNHYCLSSPGEASTEGYIRMARITITAANADTPITFVFSQRRAESTMTVYITFENSTATASDISTIRYEGTNYGAFLIQADDLIWDLYVQKSSAWDTITLQDWYTSRTMESRVSIAFPGDLVSKLPGSYYRATPAKLDSLRDHIYPIGSIYISYSHVDPAELFGGEWARIENAFLWATTPGGEIGLKRPYVQTVTINGYNYIQVSVWRRTA